MARLSVTTWPRALARFAVEARDELKKVSWPTRQTTVRYTMIVIVSSLAVGLAIGGVDYLLTRGLEYLVTQ